MKTATHPYITEPEFMALTHNNTMLAYGPNENTLYRALIKVCGQDQVDFVKTLHQRGFDLDTVFSVGSSNYIGMGGRAQDIQLKSLATMAISYGALNILHFIAPYIQVNSTHTSATALGLAAHFERIDAFSFLLTQGANPWIPDKAGLNTLDQCMVNQNRVEYLRLLDAHSYLDKDPNHHTAQHVLLRKSSDFDYYRHQNHFSAHTINFALLLKGSCIEKYFEYDFVLDPTFEATHYLLQKLDKAADLYSVYGAFQKTVELQAPEKKLKVQKTVDDLLQEIFIRAERAALIEKTSYTQLSWDKTQRAQKVDTPSGLISQTHKI